MKSIYLVRHADAHAGHSYDSDHDRELTADGAGDARRLGRFLAATDQIPDRIFTSSAVRAEETATLLPDGGQWMADVPIEARRNLYEGGVQDVLETIQGIDSSARAVLLVGHQPTWGEVVRRLAGDARIRVPTGTGVRIDLDIDAWTDAAFGDGIVEWVLPPRLLR